MCEPFRVFDCCYEVDGAVALVLTSADRAKDLKHKPVYPLGVADGSGCGGVPEYWDDLTTMYSRDCAPCLWDRTGLKASDMDVALMYDCFTFTVMATFEDFGFCRKGEVGDFFREGRATYGGDVVVNPHGGLLSEGYLHGLNHHFEAVLQLRGEAADAPGARRGAGARHRRRRPVRMCPRLRDAAGVSHRHRRGRRAHPTRCTRRPSRSPILTAPASGRRPPRVSWPCVAATAAVCGCNPLSSGAGSATRPPPTSRSPATARCTPLSCSTAPSPLGTSTTFPYVVAIIEFDEQKGLRLPGRIVDVPHGDIRSACG